MQNGLQLSTQEDREKRACFILQLILFRVLSREFFKFYVVGADNLNLHISSSEYLPLKLTNIIMSELFDKVNYFVTVLIIIY